MMYWACLNIPVMIHNAKKGPQSLFEKNVYKMLADNI